MYTFADASGNVYTVTNLPDVITIPPHLDPNPQLNKSLRELLRPQYAVAVPELPYLLRQPVLGDPLLGRLCYEASTLEPIQYRDGWALQEELRKSWVQLERGLLHVSNLLLSLANTAAARSIGSFSHWSEPAECGYTRAHRSEYSATIAIRKSREAFLFLAARCTLAIAVWLAGDGALASDQLPSWVKFLTGQGVPSSWIDALHASAIARLEHGLRVGVFIDVEACPWIPHIPIMRHAKLPLFIRWNGYARLDEILRLHARVLENLRPYRLDEELALRAPPRPAAPHVYMLYLKGEGRPHPFIERLEARLSPKPAGPFQLPGESRPAFLERMAMHQERVTAHETAAQEARRRDREAYADSGRPPKAYSRVYLWIKAGMAFPDLPEEWKELDFRAEVQSGAVLGLWHSHGPAHRQYNSTFDEWDLWSGSSSESLAVEPRELSPSSPLPDYENTASLFQADNEFLYHYAPVIEVAVVVGNFRDLYLRESYLKERYGLYPDTRKFRNVDYAKYAGPAFYKVFGFAPTAEVPLDPEVQQTYAGWAWAMRNGLSDTPALQVCWDMSPKNVHFLFAGDALKNCMRATKKLAPDGSALYLLSYTKDQEALTWTLRIELVGNLPKD